MNKLFFLLVAAIFVGLLAFPSCEYHNGDDQTQPDNKPEPIPDPEPEPAPEEYLAALRTPNCFMVAPGTAVEFPILKAYAIWHIYSEQLGDYTLQSKIPSASLLWQDEPGLITDIAMDAADKEFAVLHVTTSRKHGNAVVAVTVDGQVRWSWHIWVTDYDPDKWIQGRTYNWDNNGDGKTDYVWMDRNLGALSNGTQLTKVDSLATAGLMYQWGRKDPLPGDRVFRYTTSNDTPNYDSRPIYDMQGDSLVETGTAPGNGVYVISRSINDVNCGLKEAITSPMVMYLGVVSYNDWYASPAVRPNDMLWGMNDTKSPFDPSPEGWRIPSFKNGKAPWNGLENMSTPYSPLGVFPAAGFRYVYNAGSLKNSGVSVYIWTADVIAGANGRLLSGGRDYTGAYKVNSEVSSRSTACPVRCVRE